MLEPTIVYGVAAVFCAFLLTYLLTPAVRALSFKIGAIDVPHDDRRMHDRPIPQAGGLAVFISFIITTFVFSPLTSEMIAIWTGGAILIVVGVLDDIYDLNAWIKLIVQIAAAVTVILQGVIIDGIYLFDKYIDFGIFAYPLTVLWIVVLVNAFNLIDGLDGLSSGMCAISCITLICVALMYGNWSQALIAAVLFGTCCGFLPYNFHPARIFIGDTGAYFLGFVLAVISIEGVFKISAVISFLLPVMIFALPLLDVVLSFFRRIISGKAPFSSDKKHLHHRLIALGLSQRHAVLVMYAVSGLFGLIAIIYTDRVIVGERIIKAVVLFAAVAVICIIDYILLQRHEGVASQLNEQLTRGADKDAGGVAGSGEGENGTSSEPNTEGGGPDQDGGSECSNS